MTKPKPILRLIRLASSANPYVSKLEAEAWSPRRFLTVGYSVVLLFAAMILIDQPPNIRWDWFVGDAIAMPIMLLAFYAPLAIALRAGRVLRQTARGTRATGRLEGGLTGADLLDGSLGWSTRHAFRTLWLPALVVTLALLLFDPLLPYLGAMSFVNAVYLTGLVFYPVQCLSLIWVRRDLLGSIEFQWRTLAFLGPCLLFGYLVYGPDSLSGDGLILLLISLPYVFMWTSRYLSAYLLSTPSPTE